MNKLTFIWVLFFCWPLIAMEFDWCASEITADKITPAWNPFTFSISFNSSQEPFERGEGWDIKRMEAVANQVYPVDDIVIYQGFFRAYQKATGVGVEVHLGLELYQFLNERGIPPGELKFLDDGLQGALYTHPKLGNSLLKIQTTTLDGVRQCQTQPACKVSLDGNKGVARLEELYFKLSKFYSELPEQGRPAEAALKEVVLDQTINVKRYFRMQGRAALHRAHQLMLPGLIAGQAGIKYFDFARVHFIGNGFFLREYYPDGELSDLDLARDKLKQAGISEPTEALIEESESMGKAGFPILSQWVGSLVGQAPSYVVSPSLFEATRNTERPRLLLIYDLD